MIYTPDYYDIGRFPYIRDMSDLPVLISAILEDADILLTGDNDFDDVEIEKPEILKPAEFLLKYVV